MVSLITCLLIIFSCLVSLLLPIGLFIYLYKKFHISLKVIAFGVITFVLFVLILESFVNNIMLSGKIITNPLIKVFYGALAAGFFEECGRYIVMHYFLKKNHNYKDGLAFGIGHGGFEAIIVGFISMLNLLIYSILINTHSFDALVASNPNTQTTLLSIKTSLINNPSIMYLLPGLERIFALTAQLAFSVIVIYAVRTEKIRFLFLAIGLHFLLDLAPSFYQQGYIGIYITEGITFIFFLFSFAFLFHFRNGFHDEHTN